MIDLKGKNAIITGSSRGIGAACAKKLAGLGANVVINHSSASSKEKAQETAAQIRSEFDVNVLVKQADVSKPDEADELVKSVLQDFTSVDILVNNAGITRDNLLMRMKQSDWEKVIDTNLTGVFNTTKAVIRSMMKARQGKIINLTSIVGIVGNAGQTNYSASKAGLIGFTKSLAQEVASRNISVNAVAPGYIETDMTAEMPAKAKESLLSNVPLNRAGTPEEVANVVAFLSSNLSDYITGEVIKVTGGMGM